MDAQDLHLAAETAFETGAVLPAMGAAKELFGLAMRQGMGGEDFSAVYKVVREKR